MALNAETDFMHEISPLSVPKKTSAIVWEVITVRLTPLTTLPPCNLQHL
jgi:hypothetical protein